jgi:hypothetical protein
LTRKKKILKTIFNVLILQPERNAITFLMTIIKQKGKNIVHKIKTSERGLGGRRQAGKWFVL